MIRLVLATLLLALVGGMHPLHAQSVDWRAVTRQDLAAARNLLREVHPAAQLRVGDTAFRAALDSGFATAMALADRVSDAGGYRAVLRRFANGFDDGHISVSFTSNMLTGVFRWAGIMVRRVAGEFVVAHVDSRVTNVRVGDRVVSCDGTSIDALARLRLGRYRAVWSVEADIVRTAFYLLLDDGNPFEPVASQCTVVTSDTVSRVVSLTWTPIDAPTLNSLVPLSAGFMGVRSMDAIVRDDVYWISMSHMGSDADAMLQSVARTRQRLNGIGAIVIDLRGNGGGSSRKGEELMTSLFGGAAVKASRAALGPAGTSHWRAAPFVVQSLRQFAADRGKTYGAQSAEAREWHQQAERVQRAVDAGELFWPTLSERLTNGVFREPARKTPSGLARRTVVLTDHLCFSSCLMLVAQLRTLGVTQIGSATNASRRYMEVRGTPLPSGYSSFTTLQKVQMGGPDWFGPYVPDIALPASIATQADVEAWAAQQARSVAQSRRAR
jgi:hypothetical protein